MAQTTIPAPIRLTRRGRIVRDMVAGVVILAVAIFGTQLSHLFWSGVAAAAPVVDWLGTYATPVAIPVVGALTLWALLLWKEGRI